MDQLQVHYELFVRKTPGAPWTLEMASENRAQVVETAETLMDERRVAAVRVSKETLDDDSREFQSVVILSKGHVECGRKRGPSRIASRSASPRRTSTAPTPATASAACWKAG